MKVFKASIFMILFFIGFFNKSAIGSLRKTNEEIYTGPIYSLEETDSLNAQEIQGLGSLSKGDHLSAGSFFHQAIREYHKRKDLLGEVRTRLELIQAYIQGKNLEQAGLNLQLVQMDLKSLSSPRLLFKYYQLAIHLAQSRKDYESAFLLSQNLLKAKDSLQNEKADLGPNPKPIQPRLYSQENELKVSGNQILESREKYAILIGILLVTLLIVGLVFLYSLYRAKRNAFDITEQANFLIHQKNEELERLNQLKNKLFSIIAHDVRSPLNNLAGVLSLIGQGLLEHDEVQQITGKLTNNVKETTNFLDNLLIWSRSQMNGIRMDLRELEMVQLANETIEVFRFQCEEKKLTLKNQVSENIFVYADREMIRMVLRNLVSNAIKFSIPGGTIIIKGSAKAEDDFAVISVSDDGIGVKKEFQDKLFGVDNYSTVGTMDEKGSGIGLMLCRDFVERNGGKIWMESTQNKGSNFFFSLPQYHMAKRDDGIKNLLADIL